MFSRIQLEWSCFAAAGLERINLKPENFINLDWMIPAQRKMLCFVAAWK
jgi:hydroxymethylbilane synthase